MTAQLQVSEFKKEQAQLVESIMRDLAWAKVAPKSPVVMDLVSKSQELGTAAKAANQAKQELQASQQDCQELQEQLIEYKGLTQQLQEEK